MDVVASWCFTRFQLFDGGFKLYFCKVGRQVGIGGRSLESEMTSRDVQRAKSLSASGKRPLFRSCEAIAFAVTGHLECVVLLPVSLFRVCHAENARKTATHARCLVGRRPRANTRTSARTLACTIAETHVVEQATCRR